MTIRGDLFEGDESDPGAGTCAGQRWARAEEGSLGTG